MPAAASPRATKDDVAPARPRGASTASLAVLALLALAALAAPAVAHEAAPPPDQYKRVVHDIEDDCGPHQGTNDCRGARDLVDLSVGERHQDGKDVVMLRYVLDEGDAATTFVTTFSSPGGTRTLTMRTSDDRSFSNEGGYLSIGDAQGIGDGTRYAVVALVERAALGNIGDRLSGFKVEARTSAAGDTMPGECSNTLGGCLVSGSQREAQYATHYDLRGASYYATVTGPSTVQVEAGADKLVDLTVRNGLPHQAQTLHLEVQSQLPAGFHQGAADAAAEYTPTLDVALQGRASTSVHLRLQADAPSSGTITVVATTDLGGRSILTLPYEASAGSSGPAPTDGAGGATSKDSPALAALLIAALPLAAAIRRRA